MAPSTALPPTSQFSIPAADSWIPNVTDTEKLDKWFNELEDDNVKGVIGGARAVGTNTIERINIARLKPFMYNAM